MDIFTTEIENIIDRKIAINKVLPIYLGTCAKVVVQGVTYDAIDDIFESSLGNYYIKVIVDNIIYDININLIDNIHGIVIGNNITEMVKNLDRSNKLTRILKK